MPTPYPRLLPGEDYPGQQAEHVQRQEDLLAIALVALLVEAAAGAVLAARLWWKLRRA